MKSNRKIRAVRPRYIDSYSQVVVPHILSLQACAQPKQSPTFLLQTALVVWRSHPRLPQILRRGSASLVVPYYSGTTGLG